MEKELLIIDDHQGIRLLLSEVFHKEGYFVHLASTGAEALRIAKERNIDCVLVDMKIPDMSGIEIIKKLREIKQESSIIMMSGFSENMVIKEAFQHGVSHFFTKPFNIFELIESVKKEVYI
ncbi:MAG TPA: response regulator [Ureibacillus sp.]|nr:response regulator [Ureibacillus sp.]